MRSHSVSILVVLLSLAGQAGAQILPTTFMSTGNTEGNMFDLRAMASLNVNSLDVNLDAGVWNLEVYVVTAGGTFVGHENNPQDWTLVAQAPGVVSNGPDTPTSLGALSAAGIPMNQGQTLGFYVTMTNGAGLNDTAGTAVGNVFSADANLQCLEGVSNSYPFGTVGQPRVWNGRVHYGLLGCNLGSNITVTLPPPAPKNRNDNVPPTEVTASCSGIGLAPPINFSWSIMGQVSPTKTETFVSAAASYSDSWAVPWTASDIGYKTIVLNVSDSCPVPNTGTASTTTCVYSPFKLDTNVIAADLVVFAPSLPCFGTATDGWTFVSLDTSGPPGSFIPDGLTQLILQTPAAPGNLLHFTLPSAAGSYPASPYVIPPGTFPAGLQMDVAIVYFDSPNLRVEHLSTIERVLF